jgi:glycosyltransferase involved in cell wall biosynthesis
MNDTATPSTVLMTTDTVGGVWSYAIELCGALRSFGIEVILATMGRRLGTHQRTVVAALKNVTVEESAYRLEWMDEPWHDVERAGSWLLSLEALYKPDIVHLNNYAHGALPWGVPVVVVGHSCVYSWFEAVKGTLPPRHWSMYHRWVAGGLRGAGRVVAPSAAMLAALEKHYGPLSPPRLSVIPNGCGPRMGMAVLPREPFLVSAGRVWDEAKNMTLLDRIASAVDWPIVLAGECRHPDGHTVALRNVKDIGRLSHADLMRVFARACIYVSAALYEPFGLSALEAGQHGCALLLPDIPGSREIWDDNALFASPHSDEEYIAAIQRLVGDPPLRRRLGERAHAWALRYPAYLMAHRYHRLYCAMLRVRRQAAVDHIRNRFEEPLSTRRGTV